MENKVNHALVGAFVLVLGGILVAAALWLAAGGATRKQHDLYLAIVDESVSGLNRNAPVKFNGVDVGQVRDIALDSRHPERVRLLFAIERGTPVYSDTVATLKIQGLTGIAYVELSGGTAGAPPLTVAAGENYPVIRTKPSLGARLENVLTGVLGKLDQTTSNIDAMLSNENRIAVTSALADLAAVSRTLAERKDSMDSALRSAARTFAQAEKLVAQAGPVLAGVGRGAASIDKLGQEASLASRRAGEAAATVSSDVQRFGNETLPELQRLMGEMSVLSASLRRLTEQAERGPAGLLLGAGSGLPGPGESAAPTR
jgi:phospholipid/cholesterol/gamma-HCH transport system substrate-binding protein